ncbi:MAG: hypothetical protein WDN47_05040 [Candidatus Doudnabacteria bacterium]
MRDLASLVLSLSFLILRDGMFMSRNKQEATRLFALTVILISVLFLPHTHKAQAQAAGLPFGGRLLFTTPPIITVFVNCPAIATVSNFGPGPKVLHLLLPPIQPRSFYNFYLPGVAVLGTYFPTPLPFNCPIAPIFPAFYFGTSGR